MLILLSFILFFAHIGIYTVRLFEFPLAETFLIMLNGSFTLTVLFSLPITVLNILLFLGIILISLVVAFLSFLVLYQFKKILWIEEFLNGCYLIWKLYFPIAK